MNKKKIIDQLIKESIGYLIASMASKCDISRTYLAQYVKENEMEKVARGIYYR